MTAALLDVKVAPPEFGEGIAQFLVERQHPEASGVGITRIVPFVVWVEIGAREPSFDTTCGCPSFRITMKSQFALHIEGVGGHASVCACMGRLIE